MARLEQGESFDAAPVDVNGQPVTEDNNATEGGDGGSNKPQLPKLGPKQLAIAGVAGVVLIVAVILFMGGGNKGTEPSVSDSQSAETTEYTTDPAFAPSIETEVSEEDTLSEPTYNENAGVADPIEDPYAYIAYSKEEVADLRGWGYTGDEIEYYAQQGASFDKLVDAAMKALDEKNEEWRQSVLDESSDGYKKLMEKTFLGSPTTRDTIDSSEVVGYRTVTENVDYTKCGVYNYQAWIKVQMSFGDVMMNLELPRYSELPDEGNIVVKCRYDIGQNDEIVYIEYLQEVVV